MWKDSTHGGSKHDDDSAIGDSAGEESSHSAQMRKSSEVDEDPLMKMNEKLGIEMPHCLLPSNDRKTTTRSFTTSETNNKSGGADGYKMKNNMESKLDYLLTEMSKLRQIDQDLLYKFTHINRNVEEIKYLMEERVADIQNNMQEYQSTNNINGGSVHSSTTQSTTQLSPNTMIEVDNNQAAYVVPINSKVPLAYAVTKRVTDENTKFVAVSPPVSPPPQPPPPPSTTTTVPTPPRQRGHQHTASSSSSSSMVSDDSMSCFVRSCDDDDAVKVSSHHPHHQQEQHQQQIWVRNTNLITASAYKQPPTSQTCYSTSKSYPKTNSETATSNTNGTSTVDDDDDDYLLLHSSSGKTRSNSSSFKLYRGNNGNNYHSNNQNSSSSSSSNHHHRHSNVTSVPSFHTNHYDNNNKNLWKSRTMSNPPPSNWRNLVLSRSNTTSTSSSAASKFSMQLSSRLAKFGNNIGAFKRSSSKSSSSSTSKSVTSGDSTTSTSSSSIVSRWHKLTRKTSDLSNRPPPPPPQQQQVVNTTNYITNTTTRYNITDDDDVTYL